MAELEEKRHENAELDKQIIEERSAALALRTTIDAFIAKVPSSYGATEEIREPTNACRSVQIRA